MADEKMTALAARMYAQLCATLDNRNWRYEKDEEKKLVHFRVSGDDLPMNLIVIVDTDRQAVRVLAPLDYKMPEDKRMEGAIATCVASYGMVDGSFDYDLSNGRISFRMTASFRDSILGERLFAYLIDCSCAMVDQYNDKFLALGKGMISINDFINQEN